MRKSDFRDLKRFALFAELDDTDREVLAQELIVRELDEGARLFERGDPADSLLLVMEGNVRVRRETGGEWADLAAGSCIGALSLVGGGLRETHADTTERTRLFELSRQAFERLVVTESRTACRLLQVILRDQVAVIYEAAVALGADGARSTDPIEKRLVRD